MEPPHDYPPEYDTDEIQKDRILHLEQVEESMNKLAGELTDELSAITAERDLWRWRFEELVKRLEPGEKPEQYASHAKWCVKSTLHAAALEIMAATPKGDG